MIGIALASRDPDELIDIMARDLGHPGDYLEICTALAEEGRVDEAVEWATRGMAEYPDRTHQLPPLRDFLSEMLRAQGEDAEAVDLYWVAFVSVPTLSSYKKLLAEAGPDAAWWSERCIEELRNRMADLSGGEGENREIRTAALGTVRVQILMYEGDIDGAWTVAVEYGCDARSQMTLARAREKDHPLDAIPVYERELFTLIDKKKNPAYKAAVDLLGRIHVLADRGGKPELFTTILERVRTEHKAKRNLKKLLDARGW